MQNSEEIESKQTSLWKIAFSRDCDPEKDDLFQILYWFKQLMGIIIGIIAGYYHFQGIFIIIGFLLVCSIITYIYSKNFLGFDLEKIEQSEIFTEGLMMGFACFISVWILSNTFIPE